MTRRDTIIVAVLINAGLLVVLFISSLKNDANSVATAQEKKPAAQALKKEVPLAKAPSDQVDQILAQYSKKLAKESVKEEKKVQPAPKESKIEESKPREEKHPTDKNVTMETAAPMQEVAAAPKESLKEPLHSSGEQVRVIVKKGDVLEKLAKTYGTTVGAIMQENHLTDSRLQIGQVIYITPKPASPIKALPQDEQRYYVVKNGDNLWKIAIEHHIKVEDLLKLNQLNEKQAKALRPGDRLRIK